MSLTIVTDAGGAAAARLKGPQGRAGLADDQALWKQDLAFWADHAFGRVDRDVRPGAADFARRRRTIAESGEQNSDGQMSPPGQTATSCPIRTPAPNRARTRRRSSTCP